MRAMQKLLSISYNFRFSRKQIVGPTVRGKNATPRFRWGVVALTLGICSSLAEQAIAQNVGRTSQALVQKSGAVMWTQNGNHVPMCWHQLNQFRSASEANGAKAFVVQTIQDGWASLLNLKLSWVDCPTSGSEKHVRVMLRSGDPSTNGTTLKAGMATLSTAAERTVPPPKDPPGLLMGFPANWNQNDQTRANFRSLILHEFGHVLGFDHEQVRPDGPKGGSCYNNALPSATSIGPLDPKSIMGWSYCTEALGALSPDDVRAARSVYGTGRSGSNDFNGDGRGDILWHNASTGETQVWFMSGASRIGRATITDGTRPILIGAPWNIVGSRDFNGDRKSDVLWYNSATGETQLWFMDGHRLAGRGTILGENGSAVFIGPPWSIVGTNDMNGDGRSDIIWHNSSTGETQVWFMNGHRLIGRATVLGENGSPALVGSPFRIAGTNDMNGDGRPDIVWHNSATGETQLWFMNGHRLTGRATVFGENGNPAFVGSPFRIVGTNDFNQDGRADILWHNSSTGEAQIWFMKGRSLIRRASVEAVLDGGGARVGLPWSIMNQ